MILIYIFAVIWFLVNIRLFYTTIQSSDRNDVEEFADEILEMGQEIPLSSIARTMRKVTFIMLLVDLLGFSLTYMYAYNLESDVYYKILLFLTFLLVFFIDQALSMRYNLRMTSVIGRPDIRPNVIKRWMQKNHQNLYILDSLAALAKVAASFQLLLYTVINALF